MSIWVLVMQDLVGGLTRVQKTRVWGYGDDPGPADQINYSPENLFVHSLGNDPGPGRRTY